MVSCVVKELASHTHTRRPLATFTHSFGTSVVRLTKMQSASILSVERRYYPLSLGLVEDVEEYRPGGFHPVHLGDVFQERFKVLHKLGSGGFSTTWLARDNMGRRYVALKILKAEETAAYSELRMLRSIAGITGDHPGRHHIRLPLYNFLIKGSNGCHNCLVTDIAGPSLNDLYNVPGMGYAAGARRLRAELAHKVIAQVVEAVEFLHSNGVVHGGEH